MIQRSVFNQDHLAFKDAFAKFTAKEIAPFHAQWEEQGFVGREVWRKAGANGYLCMSMPQAFGGSDADKMYSVAQFEVLAYAGFTGVGFGLHSEIVAPYLLHYGTDEQKKRYLPKLASGELVGAIAMSEPAAGSDLQGIQTTANAKDGGYVINGSKTFITNGWHADLVIVVAKTDPSAGAKGTSLFLVEAGTPGFEKGQRLKKLGMKAQDTSELFFKDVQVGSEQLLGGEAMKNKGFVSLMEQLPWERLQIAITAVAASQAAIDWTVAYVKDRQVFKQSVGSFQNTRYVLADLQAKVQAARVFVDKCCELVCVDELDTATASMAKSWCTDLQCQVMDDCLQLFGGYGYMWEYPITRAYADARVQRIYGGTNEIMKEVIARSMGLHAPR